uniref:Hainantoxin-XVIII-4 n=1 Tax=Cyriopagopus hainanus TaxID=2781057 RepID=H18D1_CYRHA|nr:RecName: Full=Hainantoxin-XVIII-4; Short=HNTX-XVIII-4; Flags: Precursor [Haplopelma hainanum]ADB56865.1 HNTX-XVIII-4 precursor [Haplopelma hainanum]
MKLSIIIIATSLVIAVVAFPSKDSKAIENDKTEQRMEIVVQETARACSKQIGDKCKRNCECYGKTVVCGTIYVGGKEVNQCMDKTSDSAILNGLGKGMNFIENTFSFCV